MPAILLTLFSLLLFPPGPSQQATLTVHIGRLRNDKGHVLVSLFREAQGFPDNAAAALRKAKLEIRDRKTSVQFTGLPPGRYAIAILHDENDDGKMNKNGLGIPREGYGFSNNVSGAFGPPSFARASFSLPATGDLQLSIRTRY